VTAPEFPRRRPYWDACQACPDSPRVPPLLVSDGARVIADYACRCSHVWSTGWARDPDHEGRAS
jgi:hypothetical protein